MIETVTWDGIDLFEAYGAILGSFSEEPPEPKISVVSIPYGTDINITSVVGSTAYKNRVQTLTLVMYDRQDLTGAHSAYEGLMNFINGSEADFTLSRDPDATYHGVASVISADVNRHGIAIVEVEVDCSPWRDLGTVTKTVDAAGGGFVEFDGPRKAVRPIFTLPTECVIVWNGDEETLPAGSYYIEDWYTENMNTFLAVSLETDEYLVSEKASTVISNAANVKVYSICYKGGDEPVEVSAAIKWKEL